MILQENATLQQKLAILSDAAKYDVACTSSGVARKAEAGSIGNTEAAGICPIHFPEMADVSLCLKYCIPMSAYSTVNIV